MIEQLVKPAIVPTSPFGNGMESFAIPPINYDLIETEDDTPVDNLFSAKQQRLLVETLYTSWQPGFPFLADANVGVFRSPDLPPIVPDMFLSLHVQVAENWYAKEHRSYFIWKFGKPPEICIEIISNLKGGELKRKLEIYADCRVGYYVVFDPQAILVREKVRIFELKANRYIPKSTRKFNGLGLSLQLWRGSYEQKEEEWLRWVDGQGNLIATGFEQRLRADEQSLRADEQSLRADQEAQRAERLAAKLRAMGIDPYEL